MAENKLITACPHCEEGVLELVNGVYPYTLDHFQCTKCDSTYSLEQVTSSS